MINLPAEILDQYISKYFTLREFTQTNSDLDNTPTDAEIEELKITAALVDQIYDQIGPVNVTSAFRSKTVNAAVGGAENSQHRLGQGADLVWAGTSVSPSMSLADLWVRLYASPLRDQFSQIILEDGRGHVHIGARSSVLSSRGQPLVREGGSFPGEPSTVRGLSSSEISSLYNAVGFTDPQAEADIPSDAELAVTTSPATTTGVALAVLVLAGAVAFLFYKSRQVSKGQS